VTEVFVERQWPGALTDADLRQLIEDTGRCLDIHGVSWVSSLLSADRRDLVCHFLAPDAESVRIALRQAGSVPGRAWGGTIHEPPGLAADERDAANVLVSRTFDAPVAFEEIQALEDAGRGCLETHRVRFLRTYFSNDRKRMICLYRAPDAESVRIAQREANMPVDRVFAVQRYAADMI
jgi:hypothetical protein